MPRKNPEDRARYRREYLKRCPWAKTLKRIKGRCADKDHWYYRAGVKCFLTIADVKFLWHRDNAAAMEQPSMDRINGGQHYTVGNCRYMELLKNQSREKWRNGIEKEAEVEEPVPF